MKLYMLVFLQNIPIPLYKMLAGVRVVCTGW